MCLLLKSERSKKSCSQRKTPSAKKPSPRSAPK